jgi:hypothetical protein
MVFVRHPYGIEPSCAAHNAFSSTSAGLGDVLSRVDVLAASLMSWLHSVMVKAMC